MSQDKDEILAMAREADDTIRSKPFTAEMLSFLERFATLCRAPLVAEVERLKADLEQTRVQLAGCGVAAMQNTEESKANRVERGAYGWSASYGDVCRMVDSEIELRAENVRLKDDYQNACKIVAEMHAAAVGQIVGPNRGVVEDVADLRTERDDRKARALKAERVGEPVAGDGARLAQELWLSVIHNIAYQNNGNSVLTGTTAMRELKAMIDHVCIGVDSPPQPAAQEPTSAVPVVRQMVEALDGLFSGDVVVWSLGGSARPRAAIAAGQKFIKENGK